MVVMARSASKSTKNFDSNILKKGWRFFTGVKRDDVDEGESLTLLGIFFNDLLHNCLRTDIRI
jgi:hypothetical protein